MLEDMDGMQSQRRMSPQNIAGWLLVLAVAGVLTALIRHGRREAEESACTGRLVHLAHDIGMYYHDHGSYPPMCEYWADTTQESSEVSRYLFNSHPDDDRVGLIRRFLTCPSAGDGTAGYLFVTGPRTVFRCGDPVSVDDIVDGAENTVMLVEGEAAAPKWLPEISFNSLSSIAKSDGMVSPDTGHARGRGLVFADGLVFRLEKSISGEDMKALMTIDGKEPLTRESLVASGHLKHVGGVMRISGK
jgi:hypothetical protein